MKKILIIAIAVISFTTARSCDICGCGVGTGYIGILPDFNKHIFGIRYRYNVLQTHIGAGGAITYLTSKEIYQTAELWGGWNIGKNFRVMASIPSSYDERRNQGNTQSKNGPGDINVAGYYQLLNKRTAVNKSRLLIQSLWIGAGIKLPTGKYNPSDKSSTSENTNLFQLGTGSTDVVFHAMYDIRYQDVGVNIAGAYKVNSSNKYDYTYGNKASLNAQAYYKIRIDKKILIAPNAGVLYEHSEKDMDNKFAVDISGGNVLSGTAGVEVGFGKIAVGGNFQTVLTQHFADGIVKAGNRAMLHISYNW